MALEQRNRSLRISGMKRILTHSAALWSASIEADCSRAGQGSCEQEATP